MRAIAAGGTHNLALREDGTIVTWGNSAFGLTNVPVALQGVTAIAAGDGCSVALYEGGSTNRPPLAASFTLKTERDQPCRVAALELLRGCADPDGDTLTLVGVAPTETTRGTAILDYETVTYTPPMGGTGTDRFAYTVRDARGASARGTVCVEIAAPVNRGPTFLGISLGGDSVSVKLALLPAVVYRLEASTNLVDWIQIDQGVGSPSGGLEFIDRDRPLNRCRYYRARQ